MEVAVKAEEPGDFVKSTLPEKKPNESPTIEPHQTVTILVETPQDNENENNNGNGNGDEVEAETDALSNASFSTPSLHVTVRDRVKEYIHRTAPGQDTGDSSSLSGNRSLSSSQSSLRGFDKDDREWMLAASGCDQATIRRMLAANRRLVNSKFPFNGFTALHFAAKMNMPDLCRLLMDNGANADSKTFAGQTPLHLACQHESKEAIEYLMKLPCKASHTPDYSGKLPHELIRCRDAFAQILYQMSSGGVEKRGSFLGEHPTRPMLSAMKLGGGDSSVSVTPASAVTSAASWLSGVRASFRGKAGHQPKLRNVVGSLQIPGSQGLGSGSRVSVLSPALPSDGFAVPAAPSILDNLTNAAAGGVGHHHHRFHTDAKKKHRSTKKTL